ncbi:DNA polymerase IV [Zhihengliuella alba]|uniref:DNA polymerase IV n=1 Tax=Zhihengliuella alba TaxID=547018 RepID=A0ABP7CYC1_9MICC
MANPARERAILHVDMDAFFVSVELRERPELRGRQVIVGAPEGRSVVLSASYECRRLGVKSAMPMAAALRMAPQAVVIPPQQRVYSAVSQQIMAVFRSITPTVQQVSVDEAFLDVTGSLRRLGAPPQIAQDIRDALRRELDLPASVGVARNMFVAKIASTRAKPDGLLVVPPARTVEFLHELPVSALWGVGRKTEETLATAGLTTVRDVAQTPVPTLTRLLGTAGAHLHDLAWGIDDRPVSPHREEKSLGAEETFARDVDDPERLHSELLRLAYRVAERLRGIGKNAQTVAIKVRYEDFRTVTRSRTLVQPSSSAVTLARAATDLLDALLRPGDRIRLIGLRAENLTAEKGFQLSIDRADANWEQAQQAMDRIKAKLGGQVGPASLLDGRRRGGGCEGAQ